MDLFSGHESGTDCPAANRNFVWETIGFTNLFNQICQADADIECCRVLPFGEFRIDTNEANCKHLESLCKKDGRRYIYAYHVQPDKDMHKTGCYSESVKAHNVLFDKQIEQFGNDLQDTHLNFLCFAI
ncbi:MAG TPA: hypothetical protein DC024_00400 [Clostridiales bacterium]|nr:hypothetical protein [Clostridiales bacterium]